MVLKLSEKEHKVLFLVDDGVEDTVRIGVDTGITEDKLEKIFGKLEKAGLVSVKRKEGKLYSAKITPEGKLYIEKSWKKIHEC